jgi:hypothetical protein
MKIGELISTLRISYKEVQDDSKYPDSYLWSLINTCRKERINQHNKTRFCVELERVKHHDCSCVAVGCDVLRTISKIPVPVKMTVYDLGGNTVGFSSDQELKFNAYDPIKSKSIRYNTHNQYLYLYGTLDRKYVQMEGIWENIVDWIDIQYCGADVECVSIYDLESGISVLDSKDVYIDVMRLLQFPSSKPDDHNPDRNSESR